MNIFKINSESEYLEVKDSVNINEVDKNGRNALFQAPLQKIEWLLKHGIEINHRDNDGKNILFLAHTPMKFLIANGADIHALDNENHSVFFGASKNKIEHLVEAGFDFDKHSDLSYLGYKETRRLINLLSVQQLEKITFNFDIVDKAGDNLLFRISNKEKAEFLIRKGVNPFHSNKSGRNTLYDSVYEVAELLLAKGVDVNNVDSFGKTLAFYVRDLDFLKMLFEHGFNAVNQKSVFKEETALFEADAKKSQLLIEHNIDVNIKNNKQANALFSCGKYETEKLEILLKAGIEIDNNHGLYQELPDEHKNIIFAETIEREKAALSKHIVNADNLLSVNRI